MNSTAFKTDKYELTMLQACLQAGTAGRKATFDLFARRLPTGRRYGVIGGVGRAIDAVKNFQFTVEQLDYLRADPTINDQTIEFLANYRFTGKIS